VISDDFESDAGDVDVGDVSELPVVPETDVVSELSEKFWTEGSRLSLGDKISTQPAICSLRSPTTSSYGALGDEIYVAWSDNRVGQRDLFIRKSKDGGLTWDSEERLTDSNTDSVRPVIASDKKQVHLVWEEKRETSSEIAYKRWDGVVWSEGQILSKGLSNSRNPDVAVTTGFSDSMVYVVWESSIHGLTIAYLSLSRDGGVTWLEPRPIASSGDASDMPSWNTSEPRVVDGVETAYVVWRDERILEIPPLAFGKGEQGDFAGKVGQIFIKQWDEVSSGDDIRLSTEGDYGHPDVSVSESLVSVTWEGSLNETSPSTADIFVAESFDGGQTFSQPLQITQSAAESAMPRIITLVDNTWLFWQDGRAGNWEIYLTKKSFLNGNWEAIEQFTKAKIDSIMPAITSSPGIPQEQIHLLWVERNSETSSHVMYSRRDTIPPLPPDKPVHLDLNAQKGYDNDDTLTFHWSHPCGMRNAECGMRNEKYTGMRFIERPAKYNIYFRMSALSEPFSSLTQLELAGTTKELSYSFKVESGKTYSIAVGAVDEVGNVSELSAFSELIFVDSHPPEVFIHLPKPNTSLLGSTPVIITCSDDNLVEWRLQYKFTTTSSVSWSGIDSDAFEWKLLASSNEPVENQRVAFWDVSELYGVYTLELLAIDEMGNQSKADIPIVIDNKPPIPMTLGELGTELFMSDFDADYHSPTWSPDGSMIAYSSSEGGTEDIWIFDLKKHTKNRLTRDTAFDMNPVWSPDSRWLAFQSFENGNWDIWAISIDGSNQIPIIVDVDSEPANIAMDTTPDWSPNGDQLAFSRRIGLSKADSEEGNKELFLEGKGFERENPRLSLHGEIWLIANVDEVLQGGEANLIQLTQNEWEDSNPTWSPDGSKIAFQSNRHGNWDIFSVNIDGSWEEQLTDSVSNEIKPKWSPDGKRILFISNQAIESQREILALEIHNGEIISLSPIGVDAEHADWSPDLKSMVYQSDNTIYLTDFNFPIPKIEAVITRPYQGEYLLSGQSQRVSESQKNGLIDIIGIARGTSFKEYRLEYALNDDNFAKLDWIPLGGTSTSQVQYGFLGRLDTRGFQGEYILKLSVLGKNDEIDIDAVSIFIEYERPRLVVTEPVDGLVTDKQLVVVSGETEANIQLTINDEQVDLEPTEQESRFHSSLLLEEGENIITVVARRPVPSGIQNNLETVVQRRVLLDTEGVKINVESPKDFQVVNVPYITVKGNVGQTVKIVKVLETTVLGPEIQLQSEKNFQRMVLLHEGVNLISIEITDQLDGLIHIQRHVIYEKPDVIRRDINPPAITNIIPHDSTVITDIKLEISAILIDDVKIVPETLTFTFDGKEIDKNRFEFNEKDGKFSYIPEESLLGDGEHTFTIVVQDTLGNSAERTVNFLIDTKPLEISLSAQSDTEDNSRLKVILASNKALQSIPTAIIIPIENSASQIPSLGYSINLNQITSDSGDGKTQLFIFEGIFNAVPSQSSFKFDAVVTDKFETENKVHGYYLSGRLSEGVGAFLWGQMKLETPLIYSESSQLNSETTISELNKLVVSDTIEAIFPTTILEPIHSVILRSQDGLNSDRLTAQRQNAEDRGLELIDIVHLVEAEQTREEMEFILRLPIPKQEGNEQSGENLALFHWNAQLQRWEALDAIRNFSGGLHLSETKEWIQAKVDEFGAYALLADEIPPAITNLRPRNNQEVPLDRFLVEAEIYDNGSGIDKDRIELIIDNESAEFTYEPTHNRITYLPANLKSGLHTLQLSVQDRASNIQTIYSTFSTSDLFTFAEEVIAYPNPAKKADNITIRFKLTKSADVTLRIYNVAGEMIYTERKNNAVGKMNEWFVWDCKNQSELPVASGVYIYIIEAENSDGQKVRRSGKIAVVK